MVRAHGHITPISRLLTFRIVLEQTKGNCGQGLFFLLPFWDKPSQPPPSPTSMTQLPLSPFFFFFLLQKTLLFPFGPRLGEGSRVLLKPAQWLQSRLQAEALTLGGLFKGPWAPEAPSHA